MTGTTEHIDTLVIGGGQAGLSTGYHLSRAGIPFLIVDANERTGDPWRNRWDSLRLFTPNRFNSLPGLAIPGEDWGFPTKDEMADYLESYAQHFDLPIRHRTRVENLAMRDNRFVAEISTEGAEPLAAVLRVLVERGGRVVDTWPRDPRTRLRSCGTA